jgi:hypothetical protein
VVRGRVQQGKPTFVFIHYPLLQNVKTECSDFGLYWLLRKHRSSALTYGPQHYVMASTRYDPNAYNAIRD